jgi:alkanesulfonate monooxygenase SsuD/methylene tetrahydromethanopterin reductase-like flavin-dependent oxidoreductase (luciferase family)
MGRCRLRSSTAAASASPVVRSALLVDARRGIFVAPFGALSEPGAVAELAARAEERGWDGFFLWDHVAFHKPVPAIADPG